MDIWWKIRGSKSYLKDCFRGLGLLLRVVERYRLLICKERSGKTVRNLCIFRTRNVYLGGNSGLNPFDRGTCCGISRC